ncbi:PAS domain-containing protein [Sphingobium amiense]|uniref:PAS domain-containing protein n=1 Tax=Sphingobium amiense TaxID=135719 RepID=A0A494W743_9SPHN|nr:PAS domain-containing protein [Sphingobium amiense]BBE00062.1 PAS domain-containing protein [Sphingobium amiense]
MSLSEMIAGSAMAAVLTNPRLPDNPIVECNEAFLTLTGYHRDEIVGRNCRFLAGDTPEHEATDTIRRAIHEKRPLLVEIVNFRKDGTRFRNALMIAPIFGMDGGVDYFLGSQMAVEDDRGTDARDRIARLTDRQRAVLVAMAEGRLNKQIAYDLGLTERTVKMHRAAMLKALGVRTAAEAIRLVIEAGL